MISTYLGWTRLKGTFSISCKLNFISATPFSLPTPLLKHFLSQ